MDITNIELKQDEEASSAKLFGTLEVSGNESYNIFASQSRTRKVWILTEKDIFQRPGDPSAVVSIVRILASGKAEGTGKTYVLTRLLECIGTMVGKASQHGEVKAGIMGSGSYYGEGYDDSYITFKSFGQSGIYCAIDMYYEGYRLSVESYNKGFPFKIPSVLTPVSDNKTQAAIVAGLGVRTFAMLKRQRGEALAWYDNKRYKLIQSNEEFRDMMLCFLHDVQSAANRGKTILVGLDTETTGLNMLDLKPDNPLRDHVVSIPFGWKDDEAYVICTDMYYFNNVDHDEVFPLFQTLFRRNPDYSYQTIELDYCGEHFCFSRKHILLVGANAGFDIRAFRSEGADIYFDEDIQIMHYNFATDWVQGKNSLKYMTHRYLGDETLELEDLFGKQHKDKYRYLTDPELALVYGGADADYPRKLWKMFRPIMSDNLYALYRKYDITTMYRLAIATWEGMDIDTKSVKEQGEQVQRDLETLKEFIYKYAYAANRNNIATRSKELCSLLGLPDASAVTEVGDAEGSYRYKFTPANHKNLLFNILRYPVVKMSEKSKEPALDKFVLKKLAEKKRATPVEFLLEDIPSESDPSTPLVSKQDFNSDLYPLARVFITYAKLNKEYTAYYKPIITQDMEDRMFYNFSLQRAATRRILSPGQTMKGSLKELVVAPRGKLFMCFDASQIEYRHMASMAYIQTKGIFKQQYPDDWETRLEDAGISRICKMMNNPEADYHIETASMMTGLPQYQVTPDQRKMYKGVGFGLPYGLGMEAMCELLFKEITSENMDKTKTVIADYKERQSEIIRLLETVRDSAFVPADIHPKLREMLGIDDTYVGIVKNFTGFYRLFILEKLTNARTSRIRRQAGNCVIQGGAAELFRRMIYNFYMGCVEAGIHEKVQWKMLVHDEVDTTVDDDIDVCKLIDVLYTGCTLKYPDHIPYYIGIGFGNNWHDAKDDSAELPVVMVDRLVKAYRAGKFFIPCDGQQPANLLKLKRHYMCDRLHELLKELVPAVCHGYQWTEEDAEKVDAEFSNYVVRSYLSAFVTKEAKAQYGKKVPLLVQLQCWQQAREEYGFGKDFLSVELKDAREAIQDLDLDGVGSSDLEVFDQEDLFIELLDNSDEGSYTLGEQQEADWFSEKELFDSSVPVEDILGDNGGEQYRFLNERHNEMEGYEINEAPKSAFDVYVSKHYVRKHVFRSTNGNYSVMLAGSKFKNDVGSIARAIKQSFAPGSNSIVVIGSNGSARIPNINCEDEKLDRLDKIITGELS